MCGDQCVVLSWRLLALTFKDLGCGSRRPLLISTWTESHQAGCTCVHWQLSRGLPILLPRRYKPLPRCRDKRLFLIIFYIYVCNGVRYGEKNIGENVGGEQQTVQSKVRRYDLRCAHPRCIHSCASCQRGAVSSTAIEAP